MSRSNLILLGSSSCFIILLSVFIFFWSYRVVITYDSDRYDDFISKRKAVADSAAEQQILKLTKMGKELQKKQSELNAVILNIFRLLAFILLCTAFTQLYVLYVIHKSSRNKRTDIYRVYRDR